jgi:Bacterial SH3 domain
LKQFSTVPPELLQPAWAGVASAVEDVRTAGIEELRAVVSDEDALEEMRASFPSTPVEASDDAVAAWLDAVTDWLDQLIGFVPPKKRAIAIVAVLLAVVSTVATGLVTNRISKQLDDAREAPAIAKKDELEARRHHELEEKLRRLSKQFEDFASREQFPARIMKRSPVRAEANSNSKRLARLEPGTQVQVLSRKGNWYEVQYGGGDVGWVFGGNLKRVDTDTAAPPAEPTR